MRVGRIARVVPDKSFGFIEADEFRDDVFFHFSCISRDHSPQFWESGFEVEFEIDAELKRAEERLRATVVQPASRKLSHSLDEREDKHLRAAHHPRARKRKPRWRNKVQPEDSDSNPSSTGNHSSLHDETASNLPDASLKDETPKDAS